MNNLFEFDGENIEFNPILLSIPEFEKLWNRDKTKDKRKARKELIYIYGMLSNEPDNIWKDFTDLSKRENIIIADLFGESSNWVPDRVLNAAFNKYKDRYPKEPSETLLETLMASMMKLKDWIDTIDLDERDSNGRLIHNPKILVELSTQALKKYMEIEEAIEKIKSNKRLKTDKLRGGADEGMFEDENAFKGLT